MASLPAVQQQLMTICCSAWFQVLLFRTIRRVFTERERLWRALKHDQDAVKRETREKRSSTTHDEQTATDADEEVLRSASALMEGTVKALCILLERTVKQPQIRSMHPKREELAALLRDIIEREERRDTTLQVRRGEEQPRKPDDEMLLLDNLRSSLHSISL
jgi:hypothetical protein